MRDRHFPRLCRSCDAPMARQEHACWSCEASWDYGSGRRRARRLILGGHTARPEGDDRPSAPAIIDKARAVSQARLAVGRLADEGGSSGADGSRRIAAEITAVQ